MDWRQIGLAVKEAGPRPGERQANAAYSRAFRQRMAQEEPLYSTPQWNQVQKDRYSAAGNAWKQHFADPETYRNALDAAVTAPVRTLMRVPSVAYSGIMGQVANTGKIGLWAGRKAGLFTPEQAARYSQKLEQWRNAFPEWTDRKVNEYMPYRGELQNNGGFRSVMNPVEQTGAELALARGVSEAPGMFRKVKGTVSRGMSQASRWADRMRRRWDPETVRQRVRAYDNRLWDMEQQKLPFVNTKDYIRGMGGNPDNLNITWTTSRNAPQPFNAYHAGGFPDPGEIPEELRSAVMSAPPREINQVSGPLWTRAGGGSSLPFNLNTHGLKTPNPERIIPSSTFRHESGHDLALLSGKEVPPQGDLGLWDSLKRLVNPAHRNSTLANENTADRLAFGKNGRLSRIIQMRHHPQIVSYELAGRQEGWDALGKALGRAAVPAAIGALGGAAAGTAMLTNDIKRRAAQQKAEKENTGGTAGTAPSGKAAIRTPLLYRGIGHR